MKTVRLTILWAMLAVMCSSCSVFLGINGDILNKLHKGMSKQEVSDLLGQPEFRRFDQDWEEWEFKKHLSSSSDVTIIVVRFEDDRVISMDSFPASYRQSAPVVSVCPPEAPELPLKRPHNAYRRAMPEAEFQRFYEKVKSKPFKDDQFDLIKIGVSNSGFTCKQCARMMSIFSFDDEKMNVLSIFAPHIVDRINYEDILKELNSLFKKDDAKKMLRI